jgi:thiamine pyrophosphate-dependent acetolactate synthase large subunit-like protein
VLANGTLAGWARRLWDIDRTYQFIGGAGGGGLGYGYGAALGATLAHRDTNRVVVNLQADGDLMYTPGALWTAAHHRLPLLTVMFNNRDLYNSDDHAYRVATLRDRPIENRGIGVWMNDPPVDFAKLAEAQGVQGIGPVEDPEQIGPALQQAMKVIKEERLPVLVDVVCQVR